MDKAEKSILMMRISGISFASVTLKLRTGVLILSLCFAYSPDTFLVRLLACSLYWDLETCLPVFLGVGVAIHSAWKIFHHCSLIDVSK